MKDTTYPSAGAGNTGSFGTQQAVSSVANINPCFVSVYRWPDVTVEGVQSCSAMARGEGEGTPQKSQYFPYFFLSLSLFSLPSLLVF
jgi:hypothetical protein